MRNYIKVYNCGWRMATNFRKDQKFRYYFNPYQMHTTEWYAFNIGWNDGKAGIRV